MQADNRWRAVVTHLQAGGSSGSPTTSPVLFLGPHATQDNTDASGAHIVVVSGAGGASAYVQFTVSAGNIDPVTGDGATWSTLIAYDQSDGIEAGVATFGSGPHDAAFSAQISGPIRAMRLVSWSGNAKIEIAS